MPDFGENKKAFVFVSVGIVGFISIIVLPMSFLTLEYNEYGFRRQKSTGTVVTSKVYTGGLYFWGPDFELKVFKISRASACSPRTNSRNFKRTAWILMRLRECAGSSGSMLVANAESTFSRGAPHLKVSITAHAQYFLRKDELHLLHAAYDVYYEDVMHRSAVDAIKGAIPVYNTTELKTKRPEIERVLYKAVRERLGGICCRPDCSAFKDACPEKCKVRENCTNIDKGLHVDVKYFQLTNIVIHHDVMERFMEKLLLVEQNLREKHVQNTTVIRKKTAGMVADIKNQAKEIRESAEAESKKIRVVSEAEYLSTVEQARGTGLKRLYGSLGIKTQEQKNSFDYLRTLRGLDNVHLTVDFQQRIAGSIYHITDDKKGSVDSQTGAGGIKIS